MSSQPKTCLFPCAILQKSLVPRAASVYKPVHKYYGYLANNYVSLFLRSPRENFEPMHNLSQQKWASKQGYKV